MSRPRTGLERGLPGVVLVGVLAGLLAVPVPGAMASAAPGSSAPTGDDRLLPKVARGVTAVRLLGDDLSTAAARNGLAARQLREVLVTDRTARVDEAGRLHFVEPTATAPAGQASAPAAAAVAPLAETFALHSRPGADRVIFLDVDGAEVSGTAWNWFSPGLDDHHPAWDPAGDGRDVFSDAEREMIQQVWAMVAEDYAPWDVDVTTEDPGTDALVRTSPWDRTYGSHALITPSRNASSRLCDTGCGGIAYIDTFGEQGSRYQPAWVFPHGLHDSPKQVAEAVSHEVGHNLGLLHDGWHTSSYYGGHGIWAPIMGVGYGKPLVQWSKGDYPGANQSQDDVAQIDRYLSRVPDEAPGAVDQAVALPNGAATITSRTDVDSYVLGTCVRGATVTATASATSPDLDVALTVRTAAGSVVAQADPPPTVTTGGGLTGTGATVGLPSDAARLTVSVDGTGHGSWVDGYDDYGSLGRYTMSVVGCDGNMTTTTPTAPVLKVTRGDGSATLAWSLRDDGGVAVSSYAVLGGPQVLTLPGGATGTTVEGLTNGTTYAFRVVATNLLGPSPASTPVTVVPAGRPGRVARPVLRQRGRRLVVRWRAPRDNGSALDRYLVRVRGARHRTLSAAGTRAVVRRLPHGRYRVRVVARNAVGASAPSRVSRLRMR